MRFRLVLVLALLLLTSSFLPAQQAKTPVLSTTFVSLTDPACPVSGYTDPAPVTKELRVLYFPMGRKAAIKEPQSLVAHLVFDNGFDPSDIRSLPFVRRQDGVWEATVSFKERGYLYATYWIEDPEDKLADTNGGNYFEISFCDVRGRRLEQSVMYEALSYTGILEAQGIERPVNFAKAIHVIDDYVRVPVRGQNLMGDLWRYKSKLYGDTPEARRKLLSEINNFVVDHSTDGFGLLSTLNFAAYQDWIPAGTVESLLKAMRKKIPRKTRDYSCFRPALRKLQTSRNALL